ncbi:hypothetical protein [Polyangium sp. 15x6]|uniref:hypothetical protein n=1 Tax=Polyangium sp. 15x6 TaxID=3042687 RepID=UPI00249BBD19|nr:hypothetical protein [Polyangium sp. 15x6]MDI3284243.1 hypothetical protein [Polyangium sp. 15x6]
MTDGTLEPRALLRDIDAESKSIAVFTRRLQSYDVDASLDFIVEERLSPVDRAVLALFQAMGRATADDIRTYLGLGWEVSPSVVQALAAKSLIAPPAQDAGWYPPAGFVQQQWVYDPGLGTYRLEQVPPPIAARRLHAPDRAAWPAFVLTQAGAAALAAGVRRFVRSRSTRLWFAAEPLCFLGTSAEGAGYAAAKRGKPMEAVSVPAPLRSIDDALALSPNERAQAMGLREEDLPPAGLEGLSRCTPGASWEVREAPAMRDVCLVIAGLPDSAAGGSIAWQAFLRTRRAYRDTVTTKRAAHLETRIAELLGDWASAGTAALVSQAGLEPAPATSLDGIPVRAEGALLSKLLGRSDRPETTWAALPVVESDGWRSWIRVRALPASSQAAREALLAFLGRRRKALGHSFEAAVDATWSELVTFWGMPHLVRPDDGWVKRRLWEQTEMRGVLCAERLPRDLVTPYAAHAGGGR